MFLKTSLAFLFLYLSKNVKLELFTAVSSFEQFLRQELNTTVLLEKQIEWEMEKILRLKKDVDVYKNSINNGISSGVDNPVQFYLVIKNLSLQWNNVNEYVKENNSIFEAFDKINQTRHNNNLTVPTEDDLHMSRVGLLRLQDMYKFSVKDMVTGNITGGSKLEATLDANDCLQMGILFLDLKEYNITVLWLDEALNKLSTEINNGTTSRAEIMKHYPYALFKQGEKEKANELLLSLFHLFGNNENFYDHIRSFDTTKNITRTSIYGPSPFVQRFDCTDAYKSLCVGKNVSASTQNLSLICYYKMDRPFLKLAPIKVEVLSLDPEAYSFKQVISDKEIQIIKGLTEPKLHRARVAGGKNGSGHSEYRIAKVAWLFNEEHDVLPVINKRIEDMTNLNVLTSNTSEPLQIAHYGIGGYYDVHFDAFGSNRNDRIATLLFYLSTPNAGGATVFPLAGVAASAHKNDAIMWYNLFKNGTRNGLTLHAACPVLSGKKWVANKWIREYGQEFLRKCSLNQNS